MATSGGSSPAVNSRGPQLAALGALVATVATVVLAVWFLVRNGVWVLLGLAGVVVAVAGGWRMVTRRGAGRVVGALGVGVGVACLVGALVGVGGGAEHELLRLALLVVALAVAIGSARAAVRADLRAHAAPAARRAPPQRPVLLCNPWSGGGKVEKFGLVELAQDLGVETVLLDRGHDLRRLAEDAVARGADCLGMAGGDGSQALVASVATAAGIPFVCVSAGTRNHFALDLGLDRDDPRSSLRAFTDAVERKVDYATVNGRFFVNNVSLGAYATIVQQDSYRQAKAETTRTLLPELLGSTEHPFDLQFTTPDGREVDGAFVALVSNNPYVLAASPDASTRRQLDSGRLGVFAVNAASGAQAAEVVTLSLLGRGGASGHAVEFTATDFEVRSRSGRAFAGVDGEALELATPLRFRIHPGGLRLLVPEGNPQEALRRRSREVHVGDLLRIARRTPTGTQG